MKNIIVLILTFFSVTASQIFWKISSNQILKTGEQCNLLIKQFTNLWYIIGWIFYILGTFLWIYILSKYEYSKIYPIFVAVCIILSLISGLVFFRENSGMVYKIVGSTLIISGVFILTRS